MKPLFHLKNRKWSHKVWLILALVSFSTLLASSALAQDFMYQYHQYKYDSWQNIWTPTPADESTVGGDAWQVNGKWVTGHFTRNGVWVRPGQRPDRQVLRGWYSPGWGTSWHQRHTHTPQAAGWTSCR